MWPWIRGLIVFRLVKVVGNIRPRTCQIRIIGSSYTHLSIPDHENWNLWPNSVDLVSSGFGWWTSENGCNELFVSNDPKEKEKKFSQSLLSCFWAIDSVIYMLWWPKRNQHEYQWSFCEVLSTIGKFYSNSFFRCCGWNYYWALSSFKTLVIFLLQ